MRSVRKTVGRRSLAFGSARSAGLRPGRAVWLVAAALLAGCSNKEKQPQEGEREPTVAEFAADVPSEALTVPDEVLPEWPVWRGDLDAMIERRLIRALVTYNKTQFFFDRGRPRGTSYEALSRFEEFVNQRLERRHLKVEVVVIPVRRDELLTALAQGRGDLAVANLTITPARRELVDFSDPMLTDVSQVVVSGPAADSLSSSDDLAGREVHTRTSSSYYESLLRLNEVFATAGRPEVDIRLESDFLEDEDLLEMVNGGLIPMTVVDSHKAEFWAQIYPNLTVHSDVAVSTGDSIAWALRKETPRFRELVNDFVRGHKRGTLFGNVIFKRYLLDTRWVENAVSATDLQRLDRMRGYFRKYGERYDLDWLLLAAQGYQESRLNQGLRSSAGAVGVMQLLPSTAADPNVGIPHIEDLENNIHAGTKYLAFLRDRYFSDEAIDDLNQQLLALAAYNAGPARVARLRQEAADEGLDPNVWFQNVELIAARRIGRETVRYVNNIFKYYVAYRRVEEERNRRQAVG
ncbi:MAG: lytic transglycosylase F [Gemmatimonadales bacterium]|jgi:membrane-bound lytic murein transglycosylase MltF